MKQFIENISSGVIANVVFTLLMVIIGWMVYYFTERKRLYGFFNIKATKRLVIYISTHKIKKGGSIGVDNMIRSYSGYAVAYNEQLVANKYKERFNYILPSLSESPSLLSKMLFADIKVTILPSPLLQDEIESNCSIISFGSPGYNKVSEVIEQDTNSAVKFSDDNRSISINNLPLFKDSRLGFIQRLVSNDKGKERSIFYVAGLAELGTAGAANYLVTNWSQLRKKYGNDDSFIVVLRFPTENIDNYTIELEKKIK